MRGLVILTALILAIPFSAAQGPPEDPRQGRDSDGDGLPDSWERQYFQNLSYNGTSDPDDDGRVNAQEYRDGTDPTVAQQADPPVSGPPSDSPARACRDAADREACQDQFCAESPHAACNGRDRARDIAAGASHVDFGLDSEGRSLLAYAVDGFVLVDQIQFGDDSGLFEVREDGDRIRFTTDDSRLEIHDTPTGEFWYRSDNGSLLLVLPPYAEVESASHGFTIGYGDRQARVVGDDVSLTPEGILAEGHMSFFMPASGGTGGLEDQAAKDAVELAKERRQIGAEVRITKTPEHVATPAVPADGNGTPATPAIPATPAAQVTAFDELEVDVTDLPERIGGPDKMRVVVSAELDSGRTIVLDVDPAMVGHKQLLVRYFDLQDDGSETEVVIRQASSLDDVLEANDDDGQPEYWVIRDSSGVHVMVSVPHWSAHIIEIGALLEPSVVIGVLAGVAGAGVATVAMFWPRRREDW